MDKTTLQVIEEIVSKFNEGATHTMISFDDWDALWPALLECANHYTQETSNDISARACTRIN